MKQTIIGIIIIVVMLSIYFEGKRDYDYICTFNAYSVEGSYELDLESHPIFYKEIDGFNIYKVDIKGYGESYIYIDYNNTYCRRYID
jgi:hypothetical protein